MLVRGALLGPKLKSYMAQLGFTGTVDYILPTSYLVPSDLPHSGPLAILSLMDVSRGRDFAHIVPLSSVKDPDALQHGIAKISGVELINPAADWSKLFGIYRRYAILLLALSAVLMYPMLARRYGWKAAMRVMMPSVVAALLTPPLAALAGLTFTFFNAMALVLVLSIGVDYSVFCRETSGARKPVTMLAIALAASGTMLSFGLLALSRVFAVQAFGATMLIGIFLAFLFAPVAGDAMAGRLSGNSS
jgi:predicted exporter